MSTTTDILDGTTFADEVRYHFVCLMQALDLACSIGNDKGYTIDTPKMEQAWWLMKDALDLGDDAITPDFVEPWVGLIERGVDLAAPIIRKYDSRNEYLVCDAEESVGHLVEFIAAERERIASHAND